MSSTSGNPELSALWVLYETSGDQRAPELVAEALIEHDGDVTAAAEDLKVSRQTLYKWVQHHAELRRVRERAKYEARERAKGARA
jgi:transposase-like protein